MSNAKIKNTNILVSFAVTSIETFFDSFAILLLLLLLQVKKRGNKVDDDDPLIAL